MTAQAQEAILSLQEKVQSPQERIDAFLAKEEGNLWLKWRSMTPKERNEWRKGLGAAERTLLWYAMQADCRKYLEECEAASAAKLQAAKDQKVAEPNGSGEPKATAAKATKRTINKLGRMLDRLTLDQQAALAAQFHDSDGRDGDD